MPIRNKNMHFECRDIATQTRERTATDLVEEYLELMKIKEKELAGIKEFRAIFEPVPMTIPMTMSISTPIPISMPISTQMTTAMPRKRQMPVVTKPAPKKQIKDLLELKRKEELEKDVKIKIQNKRKKLLKERREKVMKEKMEAAIPSFKVPDIPIPKFGLKYQVIGSPMLRVKRPYYIPGKKFTMAKKIVIELSDDEDLPKVNIQKKTAVRKKMAPIPNKDMPSTSSGLPESFWREKEIPYLKIPTDLDFDSDSTWMANIDESFWAKTLNEVQISEEASRLEKIAVEEKNIKQIVLAEQENLRKKALAIEEQKRKRDLAEAEQKTKDKKNKQKEKEQKDLEALAIEENKKLRKKKDEEERRRKKEKHALEEYEDFKIFQKMKQRRREEDEARYGKGKDRHRR